MNPFKLFDLGYLFDPTPGYLYAYNWPMLVLFVLIFGASFKVQDKLKHREQAKLEAEFFRGIPTYMRWFAILGIIFNFFRDQNIPYLGMRAWMLLLFLSIPVYAAYVWRKYELRFDEAKEKKAHEKSEDKYLPKPKKKKKRKKRK